MDSVLFEYWFTNCLIPELPENSIVIMDNARFHRKKQLHALVSANGHLLLFLPPYSPELNPIEKYWGVLKTKMKKILRYFENFDTAFKSLFKPI